MRLLIISIACILCSCGKNQDLEKAEKAAKQELAILVSQAKSLKWQVSDIPEIRERQMQDRRMLSQRFEEWYAERPKHPQARLCLEVGGAVKSSISTIAQATNPISVKVSDKVLAQTQAEIADMFAILTCKD